MIFVDIVIEKNSRTKVLPACPGKLLERLKIITTEVVGWSVIIVKKARSPTERAGEKSIEKQDVLVSLPDQIATIDLRSFIILHEKFG
jgi:hypothetical protein